MSILNDYKLKAKKYPFGNNKLSRFVIFVVLVILSVVFSPSENDKNVNYRLYGNFDMPGINESGYQLSKKLRGEEFSSKKTGDDQGLKLIMAFAYLIDDVSNFNPQYIPAYFHYLNLILLVIFLFASFRIAISILPPWCGVISFSLLLVSPFFRYLAFSSDVYLYPLFAIFIVFAVLKKSEDVRLNYFEILLYGLLFSICCYFRSTSFHYILVVLFFILFLLVTYRKAAALKLRGILIFLIVVLFSYYIPIKFSPNSTHSTWHALHAGLFEFGGLVNVENHMAWPNFIPQSELPNGKYTEANRWDDNIQRNMVLKNNPSVIYLSSEYEEILKQSFLSIVTNHTGRYFDLIRKRIWRLLNINPFATLSRDTQFIDSEFDLFFKLLFIYSFLLSFFLIRIYPLLVKNISVFFVSLGISSLSALLIHSRYMMYNISFIVLAWIFIVFVQVKFFHYLRSK